MKLLDKREVDLAKAKERHMEVNEGKKLAEKIDQLRLLWASEEKQINESRVSIVAIYKLETQKAMEELEKVQAQVAHAQELKAEAERPLDARMQQLDTREKELEKAAIDLDALVARTERQATRLEKATAEVIDTQKKADAFYEGAASINLESQKREKSSREQLRKAEYIMQSAVTSATRIEAAAKVRDESSRKREGAVIKAEQGFTDRERTLSLRERGIIDREESHAREVARSKKIIS